MRSLGAVILADRLVGLATREMLLVVVEVRQFGKNRHVRREKTNIFLSEHH